MGPFGNVGFHSIVNQLVRLIGYFSKLSAHFSTVDAGCFWGGENHSLLLEQSQCLHLFSLRISTKGSCSLLFLFWRERHHCCRSVLGNNHPQVNGFVKQAAISWVSDLLICFQSWQIPMGLGANCQAWVLIVSLGNSQCTSRRACLSNTTFP